MLNLTFAELQAKYNKLQRFRVKSKDVKAGMYVRFGQNHLGALHFQELTLIGKTFINKSKYVKTRVIKQVFQGFRGDSIINEYYVSDLCNHADCYRFNFKTQQFMNELYELNKEKAYWVYCLLNNEIPSEEAEAEYNLNVEADNRFEDMIDDHYRDSLYMDEDVEAAAPESEDIYADAGEPEPWR
jgi:hypothetical protein